MIVVLGRPRVYRPEPDGPLAPGGLAAEIALAAARAGCAVEMVGSIGDDAEGDGIVVELGRAGVGHAALLRDPAARTAAVARSEPRFPPQLEAADVELGLRYVPDFGVLVIADELAPEGLAAALEAADFHAAAVVLVAKAGSVEAEALPATVTLIERSAPHGAAASQDAPGAGALADAAGGMADQGSDAGADAGADQGSDAGADAGADQGSDGGADVGADEGFDEEAAAYADDVAFAAFIAEYAVRLDRGQEAAAAFAAAIRESAWEPSAD